MSTEITVFGSNCGSFPFASFWAHYDQMLYGSLPLGKTDTIAILEP